MAENRPLIDNSNAQTGEQSYRDTAGRDIHQGASPDKVLSFLEKYVFEADQKRETTLKELGREIRLSRGDMEIISDALRTVRDRVDDLIVDRDVDKLDREDRQGELDKALDALRAEQRRTRRVLFWFAVGIVVALLVGGWLAYDRFSALALMRLWAGGSLGIAWALLRGR